MENTEEMNRLLDTYELSKLSKKDINILSNSMSDNEIEDDIKNLPTKRRPDPD